MIAIVNAELTKIRTARSIVVLCLVGIGLPLLVAVLTTLFSDWTPDPVDPTPPGDDLIELGQFSFFFTLILGVLVIAGEYRHGSIAPSLLVTPSRTKLLAGKLFATLIVSVLIGLVAVGGSVLAGAVILPARDFPLGIDASDVLEGLAVTAAVAAFYGALGLATGGLLRNQAGAIVVTLIWLFVVEGIVGAVWPDFAPYAIGNALTSAAGSNGAGLDNPLSQAMGFLIASAWALVLLAAGAFVINRSDVTG